MVCVLRIGDNTGDIDVDQDVRSPGGNAVNIEVLTKRLGAQASYLGCIGRDCSSRASENYSPLHCAANQCRSPRLAVYLPHLA